MKKTNMIKKRLFKKISKKRLISSKSKEISKFLLYENSSNKIFLGKINQK